MDREVAAESGGRGKAGGMIDFSKLTPAPQHVLYHRENDSQPVIVSGDRCVLYAPFMPDGLDEQGKADIECAALARNALDVQMTRRWYSGRSRNEKLRDRFFVWNEDDDSPAILMSVQDKALWIDPFTALVEANEWHKKNVEGQT